MYVQFNSMYICLVLGIGMLYCAIGVGGCVILVYLFVYMYTATVLVGPYVHSSQIDCYVSKQSTSFAPTYNQFWLPRTVSVCTCSEVCIYVQEVCVKGWTSLGLDFGLSAHCAGVLYVLVCVLYARCLCALVAILL